MATDTDTPLQALPLVRTYARNYGIVYTDTIGYQTARRLTHGAVAGCYFTPTYISSKLANNPLTIVVELQPTSAPSAGDVVSWLIDLTVTQHDAAPVNHSLAAFWTFATTSTDPRIGYLKLAGGSIELLPGGSAAAGVYIGLLLRRNGTAGSDTFTGDVRLAEAIALVFQNQNT